MGAVILIEGMSCLPSLQLYKEQSRSPDISRLAVTTLLFSMQIFILPYDLRISVFMLMADRHYSSP